MDKVQGREEGALLEDCGVEEVWFPDKHWDQVFGMWHEDLDKNIKQLLVLGFKGNQIASLR